MNWDVLPADTALAVAGSLSILLQNSGSRQPVSADLPENSPDGVDREADTRTGLLRQFVEILQCSRDDVRLAR